jgi:uncharacterized coiled-coil protein SlyX
MKITGIKNSSAAILLVLSAWIITAYAQAPRPARATALPSLAGVRGTTRSGSLTVGQADPNLKPAEIAPILKRILGVTDRTGTEAAETPAAEITLPGPAIQGTSKARMSTIRTVDFYLKDGKLIFGKLIAEDRNKVTVEQVEESTLIVGTYSKRDMDAKTLQVKTITESKYYEDLAEYFAGRAWDFKDDPDDFIQAIRCYERARRLITGTSELDAERIKQMGDKVAQLEADRVVWEKQAQSRAKLKELEFQSQFETRFKELGEKIEASSQKIEQAVARLDKAVADVQQNHDKLEKSLPALEQDLRRRLDVLGQEVETNRRLLDPFNAYPRRPYGYRPGY